MTTGKERWWVNRLPHDHLLTPEGIEARLVDNATGDAIAWGTWDALSVIASALNTHAWFNEHVTRVQVT